MIEQSAGRCKIVTYTDGLPLWPKLTIQANGNPTTVDVTVEDLHDLRYCIDRMLTRIEALPR